jgi:hypothetical protein
LLLLQRRSRIESGREFFDAAPEVVMKRILVLALFGSLSASLLAAQSGRAPTQFSSPILDEVARLSAAGASDATLISFIHARGSRLEAPTADDLIRLKQAGVSEKVIGYLAGFSPRDRRQDRRRVAREDNASDDGSDVVAYDGSGYDRPYPYVYAGGYWGPYWGYYYPGFIGFRGGFGHFRGRGHR